MPGRPKRPRPPKKGVAITPGLTTEGAARLGDDHALYLVGVLMARASLLPELLDYFGDPRETLRFLTRFAGTTLRMPSRAELGRWARDLNVWRRMTTDPEPKTMHALARQYGLHPDRVMQIYKTMQTDLPLIVEGKAPLSR